jgi:hypothetical protein
MPKQSGYVQYVGEKTFHNKVQWSIRIQDVEKWFNADFNPQLRRMDNVEFEYTEKGKANVIVPGSIRPVNLGNPTPNSPAPAQANSGSVRPGAVTRDGYWAEKLEFDKVNDKYRKGNDLRIQYQSARNAAISVVDILTREKALIIPEKKGAGVEVVLGKIEDLTNEFYAKSSAVGSDLSEPQDLGTDDEIPH